MYPCEGMIIESSGFLLQAPLSAEMTKFTRSRDLMNEWARRYNNRRCYCWAENLMLRRYWASQKKLAIRYAYFSTI